jgi:hypothetical protein
MMLYCLNNLINSTSKRKFSGSALFGKNITMELFLIWQGKKVPFGGRISCDLMSTSGVLQCVSPIMEILSVFGRILLMEGFTQILFLIFWVLPKTPVSLFGPLGNLLH